MCSTGKLPAVTHASPYPCYRSRYVVNCAGMWARQLGAKSGVVVPNQAAEHYYLITDAMTDVDPSWPVRPSVRSLLPATNTTIITTIPPPPPAQLQPPITAAV